MIEVKEDGLDCYAVTRDGAALGWVSRRRYKGDWRACTLAGLLTYHYTMSAALDALN